MRVTVYGAAREVTGSCYLIETANTRLVLDCGLFQGSHFSESKNLRPFGFNAATVDAAIITHAHLDHVGRLPKLVREGFRGHAYCTRPTKVMARVILEDAYQIMVEGHQLDGKALLYEEPDLVRATRLMRGTDYSRWKTIGDIRFRFRDAGHIFGSAFVEIEERGGARVIFSGDIGNVDTPILRPTAQAFGADVMFIESTYGNRLHENPEDKDEMLRAALIHTAKRRGVLLIPAFAIERTQALLYTIHKWADEGSIPRIPVYLDSPLAIRMSDIVKAFPEYYDVEAKKLVMNGEDFFDFPSLEITMTREESKTINAAKPPKVIIAGSGMMNGGRIMHHLVRYLGKRGTTVFIVGFQAAGTLGRRLYTGDRHVEVLGEMIDVRAEILSCGGFSAHGDQRKLLNWIRSARSLPKHIYCTHGEEEVAAALATCVTEDLGIPADVPRLDEAIEL